jgi:hypothetical protein
VEVTEAHALSAAEQQLLIELAGEAAVAICARLSSPDAEQQHVVPAVAATTDAVGFVSALGNGADSISTDNLQ